MRRQKALDRLAMYFQTKYAKSVDWGNDIRDSFSDLRFTDANRVPFPFMRVIREKFNLCSVVTASKGPKLRDLDGHWSLDVGGSYGVNVAGFERYEEWMRKGLERVKDVGPVLGPLHPLVADNIALLKSISGLDEVSFHMSGTKAVMAAVRLARFNTRRKLIVAFSDAYHGWWDGVQPGPGSERAISDCLTLKDMHPVSLDAIRKRSKEIAGVLINPVQSFHPNAPPPSDAVLLTSNVRQTQDLASDYARWLRQLSEVCRECNVPLIFDEVYSGFRLAPGAARRPGGAAVVRAHGAGGRVARRVPDVEAQHVAGDDLVHQAGHRCLHRHRGLLAPLHQRRQRAAAGASEQKPMSVALFLAAALLLGLERLFYVWVWRHPETFSNLCRCPALRFLGTPVDGVQRFFYVFKVIQIGVFLVWCGYFGDGTIGPAWPMAAGLVLILAGQVLNFSAFYRLGKVGVYYGARFGHEVPWCRDFPFSLLKHPQYVGAVVSIWGFFLVMRFPHGDWFVLPALETVYYALGAYCEQ